jgi:hypothetical protein
MGLFTMFGRKSPEQPSAGDFENYINNLGSKVDGILKRGPVMDDLPELEEYRKFLLASAGTEISNYKTSHQPVYYDHEPDDHFVDVKGEELVKITNAINKLKSGSLN